MFLISVADIEYAVDFASKSVSNYIQPSALMPSFSQLTVSFWMKKELPTTAAIFTYATSENINSIYVVFGTGGAVNLHVMSTRCVCGLFSRVSHKLA